LSLVLELVAIRLAIARAMTNRDGEDVCGCRMATIDCVVSELLEADISTGQIKQYDGKVLVTLN